MTIHRPPCGSDQEHNVVVVIRQEVDAEYQQRFAHEREEEERLVGATDMAQCPEGCLVCAAIARAPSFAALEVAAAVRSELELASDWGDR